MCMQFAAYVPGRYQHREPSLLREGYLVMASSQFWFDKRQPELAIELCFGVKGVFRREGLQLSGYGI
jgi:hypothetical protein